VLCRREGADKSLSGVGGFEMAGFVYRGPRSFYFRRVRWPLFGLRSVMAERQTVSPGGGGYWNGETGDGAAWHKWGDRCWMKVRTIKGGQWCGPWRRVRMEDV
jgi:hypothetical protein